MGINAEAILASLVWQATREHRQMDGGATKEAETVKGSSKDPSVDLRSSIVAMHRLSYLLNEKRTVGLTGHLTRIMKEHTAVTLSVRRYSRNVHVLAWRKDGLTMSAPFQALTAELSKTLRFVAKQAPPAYREPRLIRGLRHIRSIADSMDKFPPSERESEDLMMQRILDKDEYEEYVNQREHQEHEGLCDLVDSDYRFRSDGTESTHQDDDDG